MTRCRAAGRDPATLPLSLMVGAVIGRTRDELRERAARVQAIVHDHGGDVDHSRLARLADTWIVGTIEESASARAFER